MPMSRLITGRKKNRYAFKTARNSGGCFVVTSFTTFGGTRFYADTLYVGSRAGWDEARNARRVKPGKNRYRVIVTPKGK